MKVDIYKVKHADQSGDRIFLFVQEDTDVQSLSQDLLAEVGEMEFEKAIDIRPGEQRIALETDKAIDNINRYGYHIERRRIEGKRKDG